MLGGRRYETFDTAEAFKEFADQQWKALTQAEPIIRNQNMKLAIENHKDWRLDEMLLLLQRISSEFVGVCVDTGNNIALLDDPMSLVKALAPYAHSVHLKDMGVEEYEDGFLLSEVPLGEGYLDIPEMVKVLREAKPDLDFSLEMITRDPLKIPCLTRKVLDHLLAPARCRLGPHPSNRPRQQAAPAPPPRQRPQRRTTARRRGTERTQVSHLRSRTPQPLELRTGCDRKVGARHAVPAGAERSRRLRSHRQQVGAHPEQRRLFLHRLNEA